jgi:hypothetical protein
VRKVTETTLAVFYAAGGIIAARRAGTDASQAWGGLREVLDEAVKSGDLTAFDEMAKAWEKFTETPPESITATVTFPGGEPPIVITHGEWRWIPKAAVTVAMIDAIDRLQSRMNRAPDRQEILKEVGKILPGGMDDTELSRQLTRLGWNDMLS